MPSSGSAAINGFLYQILHHLDWLADVRLTGVLDGHEVGDACLVLEPQNGGDAQAHASAMHLVEQYKTRATGTWPLSHVKVALSDVRKAVSQRRPQYARYRFVTNGRRGELGEFEDFVSRLTAIESPDELDNETKRNFSKSICLGDSDFLDDLARSTRNSETGEVTPSERELVFHLLRRFQMQFDVSSGQLTRKIDALLRPYVNDLGEEARTRTYLVGELMKRLGAGETTLDRGDIDAILKGAGLRPDRLRRVSELARTLKGSNNRISKHLRYRREHDVRDVPRWPQCKPVLVIAGESGVGKSWQLARLMEDCAGNGESVVLVRAGGSAEDVLKSAANVIWQVAMGETSHKSLQAISNFFQEDAFQLRPPFYTVAVDDVREIDIARSLVRQDWASLGARLVISMPITLARGLVSSDREDVYLHRVADFSIDELDDLLRKFGHRWSDLPSDLKRLLRKPVLAGLFLDLSASSFPEGPQSEYEIFEAYWERIVERCNTGDEGVVVALAELAIQGKSYPLPRKDWASIGLSATNLSQLEAAGWLIPLERYGEVAFAHDRLLNWAVAQLLCNKFTRKNLSVDALFEWTTGEAEGAGSDPLNRFGYVAMDTIWLLSADASNRVAISQLVERLEDHQDFGGQGRILYTRLLPTLGQRAVEILVQRLDEITQNSIGDYRVGLIGDAFASLAQQDSVDIVSETASMLRSPSWDKQLVAAKVLAVDPDVEQLDRLWNIHQQRLDARELDGDRRSTAHEVTFSALRVGVAQHPDWLRDRILNADTAEERVSTLGLLLSGLEHPGANRIWREVRDVLIEKIGKTSPRSVLNCIARFGDHDRKAFVVDHLSSPGGIVSVVAMVALAVLDPDEAIRRIAELDRTQLTLQNEWLPLLFRADSELTRQALRNLAASDSYGQRQVEEYFEYRPADLDEDTFVELLSTRQRQCPEFDGTTTTWDVPWTNFLLRFLSRMCRPDILRRMHANAGGELESVILEIACSRLRGNTRSRDRILESARRTLVFLAGEGISDVINRELESEHFWVRHGGLNWAWVSGNQRTVELLGKIAQHSIPNNAEGEPDSDAWQEFSAATKALAALGADDILVEIFSRPEIVDAPLRLASFRGNKGPMAKSLTDAALHAIKNPETSDEKLRCSLVTAWLSGDSDLIPDVRDVLARVDPESKIARHACLALHTLGDKSAEFARLAESVAFTKDNCSVGLDALIGIKDEGVDGLQRWLKQTSDAERYRYGAVVIRVLHEREDSRKAAIKAAVHMCRRHKLLMRPLYDIAAESDNVALREKILEEAFAERSIIVQAPLEAIRGLARLRQLRRISG